MIRNNNKSIDIYYSFKSLQLPNKRSSNIKGTYKYTQIYVREESSLINSGRVLNNSNYNNLLNLLFTKYT